MTAPDPTALDALLIVPWAVQEDPTDPTSPVDILASETTLGADTLAPVLGGTYYAFTTATTGNAVVTVPLAGATAYDFAATAVGTDGAGNAFRADYAFGFQRNGSGAPGITGSRTTAPNNSDPTGSGSGWTGLVVAVAGNDLVFTISAPIGTQWKVILQAQ
jgi:hypothetical protein